MSLTNKSSYRYHLPPELIAQNPPEQRDDCRLLSLEKSSGKISHHKFPQIVDYFRNDDILVLNSSKVIPARLFGKKETGASVEVLLLKNIRDSLWECLVRPGNRLKQGAKIIFSEQLSGKIIHHLTEGLRVIEFNAEGDFWQLLDQIGQMPLPPYIKREATKTDINTYQTVYADERGSVAAPTAGLHFTEELLDIIRAKGVTILKVILHVGLDTFRPVNVENILEHKMHSEFCTLPEETAERINRAKQEKRRIIAVGTTTTRTLESFGETNESQTSPRYLLKPGSKWSNLFIYPGYEFKIVDGLITNFHLPESTLLMMISAFAGFEKIKNAYQIAVEEKYRFFSYGDAMLLI